MRTTTVRIPMERKAQLERLQGQWQRRFGELPTQQDLLGDLLDYVSDHQDDFFDEVGWRPLSEAEIEDVLAAVTVPGAGDAEQSIADDIDETVYGKKRYDQKMGDQ